MERKRRVKYIGDTMDEEISLPRWPRFNVYADSETYINVPNGVKPWEFVDVPELYRDAMELCENIPWLLVWSFKSLKKRMKNDEFFTGGAWVNRFSLIWGSYHKQLFLDLQTIYKTKRLPVLYFHNASFDIPVLMRCWQKLDPDIVLYTYVKSNNKNFIRGVLYSPAYNFKCELGDTMLYEMISIAKIGDGLGKQKGKDVPYTMCNISMEGGRITYIDLVDGIQKTFPVLDYITYAERDVEIQREYGENLKRKKEIIAETVIEDPVSYKSAVGRLKGITQGSFSKELVDIYLLQNNFKGGIDANFRFEIPEDKEEFYHQTVKSNMGGYTTFNKDVRKYECSDDESILVFDCNSEYPFILTGDIPYSKPEDTPPKDSKYVTWYIVSFQSCKWKEEMSSLMWVPISNERICKGAENKFYMLKEYYDLINRLCIHESKVHEIKYQRTTRVFQPYIERLYDLRKKIKQSMKALGQGHKDYEMYDQQQQGCKIIMNSIYGKLCEKSHKEGCYYYSKTNKYKTFVNKVAPFRCILSGSYITYAGRLLLLSKIESSIKAGFTVLYADTDSVMFVCKKGDKKIKEVFGEDSGNLGEWKCEGEFNLFLNSGVKKKYCLLDKNNPANCKIAWSGINKAVPEVFKNCLSSGDFKTIEDLIYIFDPNNNVIFKRQKRTRVLNNSHDQKILYDTDFQMNKALGRITGECIIMDKGYILNRDG